MSKDILNEFGPDSPMDQKARASGGGQQTPRDVMNYEPPCGPMGIMGNERPGLGGTNHGNCGTQGRR